MSKGMLNELYKGKKVLVNTSSWFIAPDGRQYKAVYGTFQGAVSSEETLGWKIGPRHADWYVLVGYMLVPGCEVKHVFLTDKCNLRAVTDWSVKEGEAKEYAHPSSIFYVDGD